MSCARNIGFALTLCALATPCSAQAVCAPPERPFLPQSPDNMRLYADLLRADFEAYIADIQQYFRCLDTERARAFAEAQAVNADYAQFHRAQE